MSFYVALMSFIDSLTDREDGQGLAEYALILALIAIVAIIALIFLGQQVSGILSTIGELIARTSMAGLRAGLAVSSASPFTRRC
jgi:pilus assembly protein Flp/PilA